MFENARLWSRVWSAADFLVAKRHCMKMYGTLSAGRKQFYPNDNRKQIRRNSGDTKTVISLGTRTAQLEAVSCRITILLWHDYVLTRVIIKIAISLVNRSSLPSRRQKFTCVQVGPGKNGYEQVESGKGRKEPLKLLCLTPENNSTAVNRPSNWKLRWLIGRQ